jgi:hypothetical protein
MSEGDVATSAATTDRLSVRERVLRQVRNRWHLMLNHLFNFFCVTMVYSAPLGFGYLLSLLVKLLLEDALTTYPIVQEIYDYARIGLACLALVCWVVHSILSAIGQLRRDIKFFQEGDGLE